MSLFDDLRADPDDIDGRLVYADQLTAEGKPRGELIAIQHAMTGALLEDNPEEWARLHDEEERIFEAHRDVLLGEMHEWSTGRSVHPGRFTAVHFEWAAGFIDTVVMLGQGAPGGATSWAANECERLDRIFKHESGQLVRHLHLGNVREEQALDAQPLLDTLKRHAPLTTLRSLHVGRIYPGVPCTAPPLPEVPNLYEVAPNLRALHLKADHVGRFDHAVHPELQELHARMLQPGSQMRKMLTGTFPALERLTAWGFGSELEDALADIVSGKHYPKLTHLSLAHSLVSDRVAALLCAAEGAARFQHIDLSGGTLTDEGGRALLRAEWPAALDLRHNFLSPEMRELLTARFGDRVRLDHQREGETSPLIPNTPLAYTPYVDDYDDDYTAEEDVNVPALLSLALRNDDFRQQAAHGSHVAEEQYRGGDLRATLRTATSILTTCRRRPEAAYLAPLVLGLLGRTYHDLGHLHMAERCVRDAMPYGGSPAIEDALCSLATSRGAFGEAQTHARPGLDRALLRLVSGGDLTAALEELSTLEETHRVKALQAVVLAANGDADAGRARLATVNYSVESAGLRTFIQVCEAVVEGRDPGAALSDDSVPDSQATILIRHYAARP